MYVIMTISPQRETFLYGPYATASIALDHMNEKVSPGLPRGYQLCVMRIHPWPDDREEDSRKSAFTSYKDY